MCSLLVSMSSPEPDNAALLFDSLPEWQVHSFLAGWASNILNSSCDMSAQTLWLTVSQGDPLLSFSWPAPDPPAWNCLSMTGKSRAFKYLWQKQHPVCSLCYLFPLRLLLHLLHHPPSFFQTSTPQHISLTRHIFRSPISLFLPVTAPLYLLSLSHADQFPSLQSKMRVVLRVEVEAVKFLKEEPHRLEALLKRCNTMTDALSTLRRYTCQNCSVSSDNVLLY